MARHSATAVIASVLVVLAAAPAFAGDEALLGELDLARSGEPVAVASDRLEFRYDERVLLYEGNVTVKQGEIELRADKLSITLQGIEDLRLRSVVAEGNVVLTQRNRRASGRKAVFDERERTVVLSGDAVLQDGPNRVSGESIVVDLGLERSVVQGGKGRVQAILYPPTPAPEANEGTPPSGDSVVGGGSDG